MLIYLPKHHNRIQFLIANSILQEYGGQTETFDPQDIYEIGLNTKGRVTIVLNDFALQDVFTNDFIEDFTSYTKPHQTQIIIVSDKKTYQHHNISYIPTNTFKIFNEYYSSEDVTDRGFILCHLDCVNHKNNDRLTKIIYPQNKIMPVKLVGCSSIQHPQNVGLVNDDQMIKLIKECSIYIDISHQYFYDAIWHNKPIISIYDNEFYEPSSDITLQDIQQTIANHTPVVHDLKKQRISNMVKYIVKS